MATITAKFASRCAACGGGIRVGEQVEWEKGVRATHTKCAAPKGRTGSRPARVRAALPPAAPKAGEIEIHRRSEDAHAGYTVGQTVHAPKVSGSGGGPDGHYWTVTAQGKWRGDEDNQEFSRWIHWAHVRPATDAECAPLVAAAAAKADRAALTRELSELARAGTRVPEGDPEDRLPGKDVAEASLTGDGGWHYALTATEVIAHHGGHYDDYRTTTYRTPRTERLVQLLGLLGAVRA